MKNRKPEPNKLHQSRKRRNRKYTMTLCLMLLPGLVCLFLFNYLPMGGAVIAFKDYKPLKGIWGSAWCGLKNFEFFFSSQDAARTIRNTVLYSVGFLILDLILGVLVAILLYNLKSKAGIKVYHTAILMPQFLSIVIVSFLVYAFLSPSYGFLNRIIVALGGDAISWYSMPKYWPWILVIVHCWMALGTGSLYYYAALTGIDPSLFDSADLDGANAFQRAWHICIPELVPIIVMMLILGIGRIFNDDMGLFYQVPRNTGMLYSATDTINTYTYRALLDGNLSKSAAVGLFQSFTGLCLVVGANGLIRKISPENSMF